MPQRIAQAGYLVLLCLSWLAEAQYKLCLHAFPHDPDATMISSSGVTTMEGFPAGFKCRNASSFFFKSLDKSEFEGLSLRDYPPICDHAQSN
jgi:hypothetical protein